jgi:hypothetical protein
MMNGWETIMPGPRWKIVKKPRWTDSAQPWQIVPPRALYNNMGADISTYKTGAQALAAFDRGFLLPSHLTQNERSSQNGR